MGEKKVENTDINIDNKENIDNIKKLTPRQKRFCEEYVKDYNGAQSAMRAGFSPKTSKEQAVRLLSNINLKGYINTLEVERANRAEIDEVEIIKDLKAIKNDIKKKDADRLKALELLSKFKGMDKTKQDTNIKIVVSIDEEDNVTE